MPRSGALRVLAVSGRPLDSVGGAERSLARLCHALASRCEVDVIAPGGAEPLSEEGRGGAFVFHPYDREVLEAGIAGAINLLNDKGRTFDIVYLGDKVCVKRPDLLWKLKDTFREARIVFKETTVGKLIRILDKMPSREAQRIADSFDAIVCISSRIESVFEHWNHCPARRILIPNGVDTEVFSPVSLEEKRRIRGRLELPIEEPCFLFSGRFAEKKNIDVIYGAWLDLEKRGVEPGTLVLMGKAHKHYDEGILRLVREDTRKVRVVGPFRYDTDLADWYKACDFFVAPTSREGLSNAFLEAAASGLYPILTRVSGYEDIVTDEQLGMLVEERNTSDLIDRLETIGADPSEHIRRGRECLRKVIETRYEIRVVADMYMDLFQSLCSSL